MSSLLGKLAREPLLHFLLIGAVTFGIESALGASSPSSTRIEADADVRKSLSTQWEGTHNRPPTDAELEAMVVRWTDEEVLYREGLARGLERDDPRIRERIAMKMGRIIREGVIVPDPTEEELRAWFAANTNRFAKDALLDFTQVFVEGEDDAARARANELLGSLRAGAEPSGMGDTFQGGRRYRRRKVDDLAAAFGETFVEGLDTQPEQTWELRESRFGFHLVRIDKRTSSSSPSFEEVRADVEKHWKDSKRDEGLTKALEELRARWVIVRE